MPILSRAGLLRPPDQRSPLPQHDPFQEKYLANLNLDCPAIHELGQSRQDFSGDMGQLSSDRQQLPPSPPPAESHFSSARPLGRLFWADRRISTLLDSLSFAAVQLVASVE